MRFEAYKLSENNYQIFMIEDNQRAWLASFRNLSSLLNYYIYCHNLSNDELIFTGMILTDDESSILNNEMGEWNINVIG